MIKKVTCTSFTCRSAILARIIDSSMESDNSGISSNARNVDYARNTADAKKSVFDAVLMKHSLILGQKTERESQLARCGSDSEHRMLPRDWADDSAPDPDNPDVLFDTSHVSAVEMPNPRVDVRSLPQSDYSRQSTNSVHVERILDDVTRQIEAQHRLTAAASSGPVTLTIPLQSAGHGENRIEVKLTDTLVTVTLPVEQSTDRHNAQLASAAAQLGRALQDHFPGKRIRILQSSAAMDLDYDDGDAAAKVETVLPPTTPLRGFK